MRKLREGGVVTQSTIAGRITDDQRRNRNAVATSTYAAMLLDQKLRNAQIVINKTCIATGIEAQRSAQAQATYLSHVVLSPKSVDTGLRQIYQDLRISISLNDALSCADLGITSPIALDMCLRFKSASPNERDSWITVPRPASASQSVLLTPSNNQTQITPPPTMITPVSSTTSEGVFSKIKSVSGTEKTTSIITKARHVVKEASTTSSLISSMVQPTPAASTTLQVRIISRQDVAPVSVPPTLWKILASPFKNLWRMIF